MPSTKSDFHIFDSPPIRADMITVGKLIVSKFGDMKLVFPLTFVNSSNQTV